MSDKKDLVVKMTINSTDFDNGLKNAKTQIKQTESTVLSAGKSMKASFGAIAAAVSTAKTAFETYKKIVRSTEEGVDSMERSLHTAKVGMDKFFQSIATGSLKEFIQGLNDITENAKKAYDALDNLGTTKMWANSRIAELRAQNAEDRVIVKNPNSTKAEREAAQARIAINMEKIKALSGNIADATLDALNAQLRQMSGAGDAVSQEMLDSFVTMFEQKTLAANAQEFFNQHSRQELKWRMAGTNQEGIIPYKQEYYERVWDDETNRMIYNAMNALLNTVEEGENGWKTYFDLRTEYWNQREALANQQFNANRVINSGGGSGSGGGSITTSTGLTWEQEQEYFRRIMERVPIERTPTIIPTEDLIEFEEIIERETDELVEIVQQSISATKGLTIATDSLIGKLGGLFNRLSNMFGGDDTTAGKIFGELGELIGLVESIVEIIKFVGPIFGFAEGGIVGGNSFTGDRILARVNSGEMILNRNQQAALFNGGGQVKFVIEGSQLKGVLDNYQAIEAM